MAVAATGGQQALAVNYSITDIGTLGGYMSQATDINNNGDVIGLSYDNTLSTAAYVYHNGVMTNISTGSGLTYVEPTHINDNGQIVGQSSKTTFIYSNGSFQFYPTSGSFNGINSQGDIVGYDLVSNKWTATLYKDGQSISLGGLGSIGYGQAVAINDAGQVAGYATNDDGLFRAFLFDGTMHDLGALNYLASKATSINGSAQVVGYAYNDPYTASAFIYSNGVMQNLLPQNGMASFAYDINDKGQVVGRSGYAFLYDNGTVTNLSLLPEVQAAGWSSLLSATAINDKGQIVGQGVINGDTHAFLLTPVPLPGAALAFGSGCFSLLFLSKRKKVQHREV